MVRKLSVRNKAWRCWDRIGIDGIPAAYFSLAVCPLLFTGNVINLAQRCYRARTEGKYRVIKAERNHVFLLACEQYCLSGSQRQDKRMNEILHEKQVPKQVILFACIPFLRKTLRCANRKRGGLHKIHLFWHLFFVQYFVHAFLLESAEIGVAILILSCYSDRIINLPYAERWMLLETGKIVRRGGFRNDGGERG